MASLIAKGFDTMSAEDAISWAFQQAAEKWKSQVPQNEEAWLNTVAYRYAVDSTRKDRRNEPLPVQEESMAIAPEEYEEFKDERLRLFILCTHPAIDISVQTPLMLQMLLGLTADEIAQLYLVPAPQLSQRLVRAKTKIKAAGILPTLPDAESLGSRVATIRDAIYGLYGLVWEDSRSVESYLAAREAVELAEILVQLTPEDPETRGLLALMLFCESRREARTDELGAYVPLQSQDSGRWAIEKIEAAEQHLRICLQSGRPGRYQLEAAIQSAHASLAFGTGPKVDPRQILQLYDGLIQVAPTVSAHLGRIAVFAKVHGPEVALAELQSLAASNPQVSAHQPFHALKFELLSNTDDQPGALAAARQALALSDSPVIQRYFVERIAGLEG